MEMAGTLSSVTVEKDSVVGLRPSCHDPARRGNRSGKVDGERWCEELRVLVVLLGAE